MQIHLIHGIHTKNEDPVVKQLIPYLETIGLKVNYPDYGFILGLETKRMNPLIVGTILPYINQNDIIIGHSNGCAIAYGLMNQGANPVGLVFINGALTQQLVLHQEDFYFLYLFLL